MQLRRSRSVPMTRLDTTYGAVGAEFRPSEAWGGMREQ